MSSLKIFKLPDKTSFNGKKVEILSNFIPPAIIGRGALLKCAEKKVSRAHASIDWDDDGILITSIHVTPTYINVDGQLKILNKGESSVLKNGDQFGLLADSFWYEILMSSDSGKNNNEKLDSGTPCTSNNGNGILDISLKSSAESDERNETHESITLDGRLSSDVSEHKILTNECASADLKIEQSASPVANKEASFLTEQKNCDGPEEISETIFMKNSEAAATEFSRQRKLPTWLLSGKASEESKVAENKVLLNVKHGGNVKKSKIKLSIQDEGHFQNAEEIKENIVKRVTPVKKDLANVSKKKQYHSISQEYDVFSDVKERNGVVKDEPNQESDSKLDFESNDLNKNVFPSDVVSISKKYEKDSLITCNENLHGVSDDDSASSQSTPVKKKTSNSLPLKVSVPANEKDVTRSIGEDIKSDDDNKKLRLSCLFGSNCYRQNPLHKNEYSHPGDEDYVQPDDDNASDDERPQCEHGIDCYRKNPQHRKAYKHTRIPQPRRRAARAKRKRDDDDNDSENEYDTDDPFLNDDSSDDYAPTDDDTDSPVDDAVEEEDTKRMIKEAKKFTKKFKG